MGVFGDSRGQAIQIGAVILFAFLVLSLSVYQATLVPRQNARVEFNHNQEVNEDLRELRSGYLTAADTGDRRSVSVALGTTYPARVLAVNPAPPSGSLRTGDAGEVSLSASGASVDDTSTLCGTGSAPTSRTLRYVPSYNEYGDAPISGYENGVFFRAFNGATLADDQALVEGTEVRLRPLMTDYSASGSAARSLDLIPTDRVGRDTVTLDASDSLTVTLPSRLSVATWNELFADDPNVSARSGPSPGLIDVVIDPSSTTTYTVVCAPVGIDTVPSASPPNTRDAQRFTFSYVTAFNDSDGNSELGEDGSIPPSSPIGDIGNFPNMRADDGSTGDMNEDTSAPGGGGGPASAELNVGYRISYVESGTDHSLQIEYVMTDDPEDLTVDIVGIDGSEIDAGTTYTMAASGSTTTFEISLSPAEREYVNNTGELYVLISSDGDPTVTEVDVDYIRVESES